MPEFILNPLSQRLVCLFENVNFRDFLKLLAPFSQKATMEEKLKFMFSVYDVDGDGYISRDDMAHVLQQRAGASMSDAEVEEIISRVMEESGSKDGRISFENYSRAFNDVTNFSMDTDIPSDDDIL